MSEPVRYRDFGAVGDGKTDDLAAIHRAHVFANEQGRPVKADDQATYYLGRAATTVPIQTDTDWGEASFIIDDTDVVDRTAHVFEVASAHEPIELTGVESLAEGQVRLNVELPRPAVVVVVDDSVKRFIRRGRNQNSGKPQTDVIVIDANGRVDEQTPILWDFEQISEITAYPIDDKPLTIRGGRFTTIANAAESKYTYYSRGIAIRRSRVVIEG
ncbi:MAG: hypothetical protein R3336_09405, partial [Phycisphaeraceae bacterium]|nr:hypothetical protein [Phycisphaeraceae bacterium]